MRSQEQFIEDAINAIESIKPENPASNKLASYLYIADKKLSDYLDKLVEFTQLKNLHNNNQKELASY